MRGERGISPMIATIILVAMVFAVGAALWGFVFGWVGIAGRVLDVSVEPDIVRTPAVTVLSATVRNTGTVPIVSGLVTFYGENGVTENIGVWPLPMEPGASAIVNKVNPLGYSVTVGRSYPVVVRVTGADNSSRTRTVTVLVRAA